MLDPSASPATFEARGPARKSQVRAGIIETLGSQPCFDALEEEPAAHGATVANRAVDFECLVIDIASLLARRCPAGTTSSASQTRRCACALDILQAARYLAENSTRNFGKRTFDQCFELRKYCANRLAWK